MNVNLKSEQFIIKTKDAKPDGSYFGSQSSFFFFFLVLSFLLFLFLAPSFPFRRPFGVDRARGSQIPASPGRPAAGHVLFKIDERNERPRFEFDSICSRGLT